MRSDAEEKLAVLCSSFILSAWNEMHPNSSHNCMHDEYIKKVCNALSQVGDVVTRKSWSDIFQLHLSDPSVLTLGGILALIGTSNTNHAAK